MELVSFSVTNYRSITKANRLPIRRTTILIGPNNEGKSNILRALVTTLEFLSRIGGERIQRGRVHYTERYSSLYDWDKDFPVSLQAKSPNGGSTFKAEFQLTPQEILEFEAEVGSKLNGTLPLQITRFKSSAGFKVNKQGRGGTTLSKKAEKIAQFVSKRINLGYIPAVRTAISAHEIVSELVEKELAAVEEDAGFKAALLEVAKLQQPVLDKVSASIRETLKEFLPQVKSVNVTIPQEERYRALRRSCEIVVDDGTPTQLARKGDGVQSLAALSLMRHASETSGSGRNLILAIEEPESHLHPNAIQQLKGVIREIASKHQVIMTTHCPLFVDRGSIKSNVLVHGKKATPAKDVKEIRNILGVRASDNLQHADLILLVEGEEDKRALKALLRSHSKAIAAAVDQNLLGFESLMGGTNLSYKVSQVHEAICEAYAFLDHDDCGIKSFDRAHKDGLLELADVTFATCLGMQESEIEDLYDVSLYSTMLNNKYGVTTQSSKFGGNSKWSERAKNAFKHQGKLWNDEIEAKLKADIAVLVETNPTAALNQHKRSSFDALVVALENRLKLIAQRKS
jgi:putative ATP-dependent endonuclease of OLD family